MTEGKYRLNSTPIPASVECESADEQARSGPSFNLTKNPKPKKKWTVSRYGAARHFPKYLNGCKNSGESRVWKRSWNSWSQSPCTLWVTREFFPRTLFRATETSGKGKSHCLYSLPERTKLRDLSEDQNYKVSLQKTYWWSRTSRRKFWWPNYSGSQNSQWKMWISNQSPMCSGGCKT